MKLAPTLNTTVDLYHKLEREAYRAYHCENVVAKADHLYNFCVTSAAMRDYFLKEKSIINKSKYHNQWNAIPEIVAANEIANTSKHFVLDKPQKTLGNIPGKSTMIKFYEMPDGSIHHQGEEVCDYEISLSDSSTMNVPEFTRSIKDFWFRFLTCNNITITRQEDSNLRSEY